MNLRTYLVKRTIHMIITMLIVLVLLFVLYRLMPGSEAAQMMMKPGMTDTEIDMMKVKYGFGRWVEHPGEFTYRQFEVDQVGRYTITVNAEGASGTDYYTTNIDVNTPPNVDLVPPEILDIGFEDLPPGTSPTIGSPAKLFVVVMDVNAIQTIYANFIYPNFTAVSGSPELYTERLPLRIDIARSDVNLRTYYYNCTTENLVAGPSHDRYNVSVEAMDNARNTATASMAFDAGTGLITGRIWGLTPNIIFDTGNLEFTYPNIGGDLALSARVEGATPTISLISSDESVEATAPPLVPDALNTYNWTHQNIDENGLMTLMVEAGDLSASIYFPVNSPATSYSALQGVGTHTTLSEFSISYADPTISGYPFLLRGGEVTLFANTTITNAADGENATNTLTIVYPDGTIEGTSEHPFYLIHPKYVEMRSMVEQFGIYFKSMLVFDFGTSIEYDRPVWDVIADRIPTTALLFGSAMILAYVIGILVGVLVAWRRGSVMEMSTIVVTLFFYSMPIFWFALIMQWVFYAELGWFPIAGVGGTNLHGLDWFLDILWHLALPLVTLTILSLAGTILLMRSSMLEVIGEDFITTAKAKGLKERRVIYHHAARNALLPVVTSMAMSIGGIISGGILTETIFSWYGMGTLLVEATLQHDFPVVQGAFYILALLTVLGNMGADILYAYLDPRVQL